MVKKLVGAMLAVVFGLGLLPVVNQFVTDLTAAAVLDIDGVTVLTPAGQYYDTTVGALIELLPILYVVILIAAVVGYIYFSSRD